MLVICSTFDLVPMGLEVPGKGGQIILCTIEFSISKLDFLSLYVGARPSVFTKQTI